MKTYFQRKNLSAEEALLKLINEEQKEIRIGILKAQIASAEQQLCELKKELSSITMT